MNLNHLGIKYSASLQTILVPWQLAGRAIAGNIFVSITSDVRYHSQTYIFIFGLSFLFSLFLFFFNFEKFYWHQLETEILNFDPGYLKFSLFFLWISSRKIKSFVSVLGYKFSRTQLLKESPPISAEVFTSFQKNIY